MIFKDDIRNKMVKAGASQKEVACFIRSLIGDMCSGLTLETHSIYCGEFGAWYLRNTSYSVKAKNKTLTVTDQGGA